MLLQITDFNGSDAIIRDNFKNLWEEISSVLSAMPLHLKASDQARIQGSLIFDPVGTNEHIKEGLSRLGWLPNIPIPAEYDFLGTDVDNGKAGVIVEVQFSNYPFLLNNTVRSELFFKDRIPLSGQPTEVVIIITKAHMFPASNSTLYYEQAQKQLKALAESRLYNVPIRLVGLFERKSAIASVKFTEYESVRHSRKVVSRIDRNYLISPGRYAKSRCRLELSDS